LSACRGRRELISIAGTSVNVRRGNERLHDTGYLLIDGQTRREEPLPSAARPAF
jgi:hypothetical protein